MQFRSDYPILVVLCKSYMKIENDRDLRGMKRIGEICGLTLKLMLDSAEAGMSTRDLDDIGRDFLLNAGAVSAPVQAYEFPGYTCISLNDEAAHGVPRKDRFIQAGDLLNVDVSAVLEGYWGDTGATIIVPPARPELATLCHVTRSALQLSIEMAVPGQRARAIGRAVEKFAKRRGYRTLRQLAGMESGEISTRSRPSPIFTTDAIAKCLRTASSSRWSPFSTPGAGASRRRKMAGRCARLMAAFQRNTSTPSSSTAMIRFWSPRWMAATSDGNELKGAGND